jgi:D-alanyl-D-alanine carboxypeptidase
MNTDPTARIAQLRASGLPDDVILGRLTLEGWSEHELSAALIHTSGVTRSAHPRPVALLAVFGAIFAAATFGSYYFFSQTPVVYSISLSGSATSSVPLLSYGALPELADPDYHGQVKRDLIAQQVSFIDADLTEMKLYVYTGGVESLQVPILAKGKIGSWWETPTGIYRIQTKEFNHLSSFGDVYMPYSLDFQGNFFIHGWPVYGDGTPVSSTYSGGCIRLSTEDAKKVYDLVSVGMPVIVRSAKTPADDFSYQLKGPSVTAAGYLVADANNGTVLLSKEPSQTAPIASITKLVTALVATEYINLDKYIIVQPESLVYTSVPRLKKGTEVRVYDLLFLLLQESSNEAAQALAGELGKIRFVDAMNSKARAIGLSRTFFHDASGAENDLSTPEDLFELLRYIQDNRRFVFGITNGDIIDSAYGKPAFKNIQNFNIIRNAPAKLLGGKIGQTREAGETYAGIFSLDVGSEKREIAVVVLGSSDSESDVRKLLNYVHNSYAPGEQSEGELIPIVQNPLPYSVNTLLQQ